METKTTEKHDHWFNLDILKGRMGSVLDMIMTTALAATFSDSTNKHFVDTLVGIGDYLELLLEELGETIETMRDETIKEKEAMSNV